MVTNKDLPISPRCTPYVFLSRCKFSNLTTRQPMVGFYLLTFPRFRLRKKEHKSYFGKNRTHNFRTTSRCAGYLLDHSGDELHVFVFSSHLFWTSRSLDVPAGVTQEEGLTGFLIILPSVVHALIFLARRIQPFFSFVDREVEFCVQMI